MSTEPMRARCHFGFCKSRGRKSRSSALVLALFFISLISVLVIGFLASMQTETFSAHSHLNGVQADTYADAGIDIAMSRLYSALSTNSTASGATFNPTNYWVSQPGRIYTYTPNGATNYDLSSGVPTPNPPTSPEYGVDLNPTNAEGTGRVLSGTNGSLYVQWIYQHQDGILNNTTNATDPAVGRFAFWVDDEGSKLNINTAYDRVASNATNQNYPSRINLEALSTADEAAIYGYRTKGIYFNSPEEVARASVSPGALSNEFSFTTYNHSPDLAMTNMSGVTPRPDLNMFGKPRIMLTTQQKYSTAAGYGANFIDILATPNTDPGLYTSLSASKVNAAVAQITAALNQTGFPFLPSGSFQGKYGAAATAQVALDIMDYVRSAESSLPYIEPVRGTISASGAFSVNTGGSSESAFGRRPYVTATGAALTAWNSGTHTASVDTLVSVYVPPVLPGGNNNDIAITPLSAPTNPMPLTLWDYLEPTQPTPFTSVLAVGSKATGAIAGASVIHGGQYATLVRSWSVQTTSTTKPTNSYGLATPSNTTPHLQLKLIDSLSNLVDLYTGTLIYGIILGSSDSDSSAFAYHIVDDPIACTWTTTPIGAKFTTPWLQSGVATFTGGASGPQQDTDASGNIVNGMFVPAPKGTPSNPNGIVSSVAELGFIPTSGRGLGNNWRTIRLQSQKAQSPPALPDWAILDLFTVPRIGPAPAAPDQPFVEPYNTTAVPYAGGKININNAAYQLVDSQTGNQLYRPIPLEALLLGATNTYPDPATGVSPTTYSIANAATLASNIAYGIPSANGTIYGTNVSPTSTNFYYSPYQLAEIKGIGDQGEGGEAIFRDISGLMTTRSDVFTIYTVGQALKQTATGVIVLGERRKQITVERYVNSSGQVVLQPVSSSIIQP